MGSAHITRRTGFLAALCLLLVSTGCGIQSIPQPTILPPPPPSLVAGKLAGRVRIGPLRPVERIGETPEPIPPQVFTSRSINILSTDSASQPVHIASVPFKPDGTYEITLPPGSYIIDYARRGPEHSQNLPQTVTIERGKTTVLDIEIDTGIR